MTILRSLLGDAAVEWRQHHAPPPPLRTDSTAQSTTHVVRFQRRLRTADLVRWQNDGEANCRVPPITVLTR